MQGRQQVPARAGRGTSDTGTLPKSLDDDHASFARERMIRIRGGTCTGAVGHTGRSVLKASGNDLGLIESPWNRRSPTTPPGVAQGQPNAVGEGRR